MSVVRRWRLLADEDDAERELAAGAGPEMTEATRPVALPWVAAILAATAAPRLWYLFAVSDPENAGDGMYEDVYHHWQIAYLTKEIGLSHGPRLWDLKGLEYFWGLLHPLLMSLVFSLSGSVDIVLDRLLSVAFGCLVVLLVFLLCNRHWGGPTALAAAAFAAFAPTSVFNDASGMLEPLGVGLCLLGIWLLPRHGFPAGICWGLAAMTRAEAWVFTLGLVVAVLLAPQTRRQALPLAVGWGGLMVVYLKLLLDQTGNPIYPLYWNFLANAAGRWETAGQVTAEQRAVQPVLGLFLLLAAAGLVWTLWKRPRGYLLLTFGFGYWAFVAGMLGFSAYLKSWVGWMWMTRVFAFPYDFAAILLSVGLFASAPRGVPTPRIAARWAISLTLLVLVQVSWGPIQAVYTSTTSTWATTISVAQQIGQDYRQPGVEGGALTLPADHPNLTYALARYGGVEGRHLVSELYDPFYYLPPRTTYTAAPRPIGTLLQCWLARTGTRLLVVDQRDANYAAFLADHPGWFAAIDSVAPYGWRLYRGAAPRAAPGDCEEAARAAPR
jgi:hypothetical protein